VSVIGVTPMPQRCRRLPLRARAEFAVLARGSKTRELRCVGECTD
jgi:hypothetical protein